MHINNTNMYTIKLLWGARTDSIKIDLIRRTCSQAFKSKESHNGTGEAAASSRAAYVDH